MGHSTSTPNALLPIFSDSDKPTWRGDMNGAFSIIDQLLGGVSRSTFRFEQYGAKGDGITDDTAAVNATIAAALAKGGTILADTKTYLCLGAVVFPNDNAPSPRQKPLRITGGVTGGWSGYWAANPLNGGAVLDLRYSGSDGLHPAKIDTRGSGALELDHLTILSGGSDNFPIFQTTNTTVDIHHNAFIGNMANAGIACVQDAVILGGTSTTIGGTAQAPFQGYGSVVHDNYFSHIRRGIIGQVYCNQIPIERNTFSTTCGSSTGGAIEFHGDDAAGVQYVSGCSTRGNTIEVTNYKYGIAAYRAINSTFGPDGFYDPSGAYSASSVHQGAIYIDASSKFNDVIDGYRNDGFPFVLDSGNTTTTRSAHQSIGTTLVQPQKLGGTSPHHVGATSFMLFDGSSGDSSFIHTGVGQYPYPEMRLATITSAQVTDAVTTTGSNVITSATANWAITDIGMPVTGPGIPSNAVILARYSATSVVLSKTATATATGVTLNFGRGTGGTLVEQVMFTRQRMMTQGAIGTASINGGAGSGATVTATGTDMAFTFTLTTGPTTAAGILCTIGAGTSWPSAPKVVLTPKTAAAATAVASGLYVTSTNTNFFLNAVGSVPVSAALTFDVHMMG